MSKIITRIFGGIGNQLFCYAAGRRLALKNNAELVLDDVSGFLYDFKYKRHYQLGHFKISGRKATMNERLEPFSRIRRYCKRAYNRKRPFEKRNYIQQEGVDFDPRLLQVRTCGTVYLEGYWQSEQYFKDIEDVVREDLQIASAVDEINQKIADDIQNSCAVALHVRWFNPLSAMGTGNNVSEYYYLRAIKLIEQKINTPHYFLFSDDPEVTCRKLPLDGRRVTVMTHNRGDENAYADLWLMSKCKHFITANSTFSWWGAWLGQNKEKIVITPELESKGEAAWGFKGLVPKSWIVL